MHVIHNQDLYRITIELIKEITFLFNTQRMALIKNYFSYLFLRIALELRFLNTITLLYNTSICVRTIYNYISFFNLYIYIFNRSGPVGSGLKLNGQDQGRSKSVQIRPTLILFLKFVKQFFFIIFYGLLDRPTYVYNII